ncbi:hypothetical protein [Polluticaenibacter yanchengensis]|uniref:Uncharacterized protein n=1 Tax=Polluticaenibacter yanchengensis TaxID=3014562 RepID=A0ABT4ULG2_9BACT|nr:hypothetical protein [Chitinophagaceae bacterium LY-5]
MATIKKAIPNLDLKANIKSLQSKISGFDDELAFVKAINEKKLISHKVSKPLEMVAYKSDSNDGTTMLALPGTIRIFLANSNSLLLKKLKASIASGKVEAQSEAMKAIAKVIADRKLTDRKTAQKMILEAENLFEFTCGTKTLLDGGILPNNDEITYMDIPYCGTPFPKKFPPIPSVILDEYCGTGPKPRPKFDGLVVIHEPSLSKLEIDAFKLIPEANREMLIGGSTVAIGTSVWYVSAVAAVAVVVMTVTAGCAKPGLLRDIRLDESTIKKFGPQRAAAQLIALREKALISGM